MEEQIGMHLVAEAGDGGSIDGNAVLKGSLQLLGHDGNVLIASVYIAEGKADEFHILLLDILHDFLWRVFHNTLPFRNPGFRRNPPTEYSGKIIFDEMRLVNLPKAKKYFLCRVLTNGRR